MGDGTEACKRRETCRLCDSRDLIQVLSLTPTPPANAFVRDRNQNQTAFPLDVRLCGNCSNVQLSDVVDPSAMFEEYVYVSGTSPSFVQHFEIYAKTIVSNFGLRKSDLVVDIGSNDGTLLRFFGEHGMQVLGVDPAREIARQASESGIETWPTFFDESVSERIRSERGTARCITANNVFAHIDDLAGTLAAIRYILSDDGVFVFEVSYLMDVLEKTLFDTIYHEHLDYHSATPLVPFFASHGMELVDVHRVPTHGGSIRCVVQMAKGPHLRSDRVDTLLALEAECGLNKAETFRDFGRKIDALRDELNQMLKQLQGDGKQIAGFGAPAKATTLMHHFDLGADAIQFIVDDSPLKQGLYSPGLHVPILPTAELYERKPDYVIILAWNFADPVIHNHAAFLASGGHFIVPLPQLTVH